MTVSRPTSLEQQRDESNQFWEIKEKCQSISLKKELLQTSAGNVNHLPVFYQDGRGRHERAFGNSNGLDT